MTNENRRTGISQSTLVLRKITLTFASNIGTHFMMTNETLFLKFVKSCPNYLISHVQSLLVFKMEEQDGFLYFFVI